MLVLSRKLGETIMIGNDVKLTVVEVKGNRIKLGIEAPREYQVLRGEIADNQVPAATRVPLKEGTSSTREMVRASLTARIPS